MKCATSTLYTQLAAQPNIFLPTLKEPNFFSDDEVYNKGTNWYSSIFDQAPLDSIIGEASTHYTKLPDYPHTINRIIGLLPNVKIIYIMRDPVERLISHYIHEWTMNRISLPINEAVLKYSELTNYGLYSMQIKPYLEHFGSKQILPVFFERLTNRPQHELARVCDFIDHPASACWIDDLSISNQSSKRIRKVPGYDLLVESRAATLLRRSLLPESLRQKVKSSLQLQERPALSNETLLGLYSTFNKDLSKLNAILGTQIKAESFKSDVLSLPDNYAFIATQTKHG